MKMRWQPSLKIIPHYESDPLYIDALVNSINKKINEISSFILSTYHWILDNVCCGNYICIKKKERTKR